MLLTLSRGVTPLKDALVTMSGESSRFTIASEARLVVAGVVAMVGILEGLVLRCFSFTLWMLLEMFCTASGVDTKPKKKKKKN